MSQSFDLKDLTSRLFVDNCVAKLFFDDSGKILACNDFARRVYKVIFNQEMEDANVYAAITETMCEKIRNKEFYSEIVTYDTVEHEITFDIMPHKIEGYQTGFMEYTPVYDDEGNFLAHSMMVKNITPIYRESMNKHVKACKLDALSDELVIAHINFMPQTMTADVMGGHDGLDYHGIPADMQSASILGIHPDDREKGVAFFKKICEDTSRPHRTILRVMSRVLQQYRYFQMVLLPMMRLDGQFGYYAGFCIDVTEQFNEIIEQKSRFKTRIASLEEEKRRSEVSQKKMEDLLSSMGHDLRSPLNAILGFSEIMASNCNTEETRECYKYVKLATEQMTMIINDILEMTRIDSGRIKFNISRFTLSDLLENIYQLHRLQYSARTCELVLDDRIEEDVTFTTDEQRVIEILNNFLSNAAKYTKQGTVTISSERKDNGVCIHVRDTGVGIQPEDCEKIFNRFETLGAKEQGYGLGLYICRKLAHGLGGEVGCQSEVGKGSDFWLWLPLD